ncbi:MAG: ribosome assembly RNA-binding protein YhbY [Granulosicoccaceae bacterium]|jgi:RNA-binding protein
MPSLTDKQIRNLRAQAHHLKPVVIVGANGLTDNVLNEIDQALTRHELLKVRINVGDRDTRDAVLEQILEQCRAERIQRVGNIAAVYRRNHDNPRIDPGKP